MSNPDAFLLVRLLLAHILADFYLQRDKWVCDRKNNPLGRGLLIHSGIQALGTYVLAARWAHIWILPLVFVSHLAIDMAKDHAERTPCSGNRERGWKLFLIDQTLHILVLAFVWVTLSPTVTFAGTITGLFSLRTFIILTGYLLVTRPVGFLVGKTTERWRRDLNGSADNGLARAGTWIGILERGFIVTFVLLSHWEAIGFLVAAKSVFRFGELREGNARKMTEYMLIGTMLSFLMAILVGVVLMKLLEIGTA